MAQIKLAESSSPGTPSSGYAAIYVDTSGDLHVIDDAGTDAAVSVVGHTHVTADIADEAVTNAKLAHIAQYVVKGRVTASTGDVEDLTAANMITLLATADGTGSGLDADLLDGNHAAAFAASDHTHTQLSDTDWQTLTIENTTYWDAGSSNPQYRKVGDLVMLYGTVKEQPSKSAEIYTFATLPVGVRPAVEYKIACYNSSGYGTLTINTDGTMKLTGASATNVGQTYRIDGCMFFVA